MALNFQAIQLVREPKSENCLDWIFVAPSCEKVIFVCDENSIISNIRKFMLDFRNIGL